MKRMRDVVDLSDEATAPPGDLPATHTHAGSTAGGSASAGPRYAIAFVRAGTGDFSTGQADVYKRGLARLHAEVCPAPLPGVTGVTSTHAHTHTQSPGSADAIPTHIVCDSDASADAVATALKFASWAELTAQYGGVAAVKHTWIQRCLRSGRMCDPEESEVVARAAPAASDDADVAAGGDAAPADASRKRPREASVAGFQASLDAFFGSSRKAPAAVSAAASAGYGGATAVQEGDPSTLLPGFPASVVAFPVRGFTGDDTGVLRVPADVIETTSLRAGAWYSIQGGAGVAGEAEDGTLTVAEFASRPFRHGGVASAMAASAAEASSPDTITSVFNRRDAAYANMSPASFGRCDVYTTEDCRGRAKIAAFDLDGTLIQPAGEAKFCASASDWKWAFPRIPKTVKALHQLDYKIVIFTNQLGVAKGHTDILVVRERCVAVAAKLGVPVQIFVAPGEDGFRKPHPGMYYLLATRGNDGVPIDPAASVFVGDAAGRAKTPTRGKDHSASDMLFALNCGMRFCTPEVIFGGSRAPADVHPLRTLSLSFMPPRDIPGALDWDTPLAAFHTVLDTAGNAINPTNGNGKNEIVLLVGPPSCGKSTLCAYAFPGHERVNQDMLKTKERCLAAAERALRDGRSVIIDATNVDASVRDAWRQLAKKAGVSIRAVCIDVAANLALHLNEVRASNPLGGIDGELDRRRVPNMIIYASLKRIQVPKRAEGFEQVQHVAFRPGPFRDTPADRWQRAWLYGFAP